MSADPAVILALMQAHSHTAGVIPPLGKEYPPVAYENTPLLSVHGNVTRDPFVRETPKGEVLNFGLAVNTSYEDGSTPTYYDVAVWNEGLQESCKAEVYKGAKVAITGSISQKVVDGKTYNNLSAHRVGLIEFLARSKSTFKPSNTGSESSW